MTALEALKKVIEDEIEDAASIEALNTYKAIGHQIRHLLSDVPQFNYVDSKEGTFQPIDLDCPKPGDWVRGAFGFFKVDKDYRVGFLDRNVLKVEIKPYMRVDRMPDSFEVQVSEDNTVFVDMKAEEVGTTWVLTRKEAL